MYKLGSNYQFAVSEVEFIFCASINTSKYSYADYCILYFQKLCDYLKLLNMDSDWDHYHDNYGRYFFIKDSVNSESIPLDTVFKNTGNYNGRSYLVQHYHHNNNIC